MKNSLVVALLWGGSAVAGTTCTYDGAWSPQAPVEGDDVVVTAGALTWGTGLPLKVASWTQSGGTNTFDTGLDTLEVTGDVSLSGGMWTHTANPSCAKTSEAWQCTRGTKQLVVSCGGNFTLGSEATIDVTGRGYRTHEGPGSNVENGGIGGAGASHGGAGVTQNSYGKDRDIGCCYGLPKTPNSLGSGGNSSAGGGAVQIAVTNKLSLYGSIVADGAKSANWYSGSGGSIYLRAGTVAGDGTLRAAGGKYGNDGGGGGGRIALHVTDTGADYADFTGTFDVSAQAGGYNPFCGTVYREKKSDNGRGELWIKGYSPSSIADPMTLSRKTKGLYGTFLGPKSGTVSVGTLRMSGRSRLHIPTNVTLSVQRFVSENEGSYTNLVLLTGGKLSLAKDTVVTGLEISPYWEPSDIDFDDGVTDKTLNIADGGRVSPAIDMTLHGDLHIKAGGSFSHYLGCPIALTVPGNCTIDAGGAIDVSGRGHVADTGLGKSTIAKTGGSHAGRGSGGGTSATYSDADPGNNGSCYGSVTAPITMGSGGRYGTGGGALKLTVAGTLSVNGAINANGAYSSHYSGAGGSAWVLANRLVGSGTISANGGMVSAGGERNGTGGGGRISVWMTNPSYDFSEFTGTVTAYGGSKPDGKIYGGPGTVYRKLATEAQNEGTLVIDNGLTSQYKNYECRVDPLVTDADVGTVIVTNNATFAVTNNASFTFRKAWITSPNARFRGYPGSTVVCSPCGTTATMSGTNTFFNFTCAEPGKTLAFDTVGTLLGVAALGELTLQGDESEPLTLASTEAEMPWYVKADGAAIQTMKHLAVVDSDATAGALMVAENSSGTRCDGWNFVNVERGTTVCWTGLAGTGWTDPGNWDKGRAPSPTDHLVVTNAANQPVLNTDVTAWSLSVSNGASLALNGFSVAVSNLTVAGSLSARGTETLEVTKDVDFTGGAFAAARSTLRLVGSAEQTVKTGADVVFHDVTVEKNGGSLSFAEAFTADRVRLTALCPLTVTFAAGKLFAAREISFAGLVDDKAALRLASSSAGAAWRLKASDYALAEGVTVSDSDAREGLAFRTGAPSSGSDCQGWVFNAAPFVWKGGADTYFTNAANWVGGVVPGAADDVRLTDAGEIVLDAPQSLRTLEIGGGAAVSLTVKEPLDVSGGLVVAANGTLVANTNVTVGGTLIVRNGAVVTHGENGVSPTNRLTLSVAGDAVVEEQGKISVTGKGYPASWKGPGCVNGMAYEAGPTHGGRGSADAVNSRTAACYGSVFAPQTFGTSGEKAGGGVIRLVVGGTLTLDGQIDANGADHPTYYYSGAAGSVWLTAGRLVGTGAIRANGGGTYNIRPGGGGRVSVCLTEDETLAFAGTIEAKGGAQSFKPTASQEPLAAPGTVYVQTAGADEGAGMITVDAQRTSMIGGGNLEKRVFTELPAVNGGDSAKDFLNATLVIKNCGYVRITNDMEIAELEMPTRSRLELGPYTLTVRSHKHKKRGSQECIGFDANAVIDRSEGGKLVFKPWGFGIIVR